MKHIDAFKCIKCEKHFSGMEVGSTLEFPFADPPRLEITCRECEWNEVDEMMEPVEPD